MAHGTPEHDYHLVNPSPWPILTSFALLGLTGGGVMFMHEQPYGQYVLIASLLAVFLCAALWWRDVIKEGIVDKAHTSVVSRGLRFGMGFFIISEVMFFFAFFWAYFNAALAPMIPLEDIWPLMNDSFSRAWGVWPPEGIQTFDPWNIPLINTLILLLSGTTVTWAHHALMHGDQNGLKKGLGITVLLGILFSFVQAYEYGHATFGFTDGVYPSAFYMATGFHGFHVILGTIFLAVCYFRARKGHFETGKQHLGFEFAAWYWHFVDVVWLFLFAFIYVWGE